MNSTDTKLLVISLLLLLFHSCGIQEGNKATLSNQSTKLTSNNVCETDYQPYLNSLNTVWQELDNGFSFSKNLNNARIDKHLQIYDNRQNYFNSISLRAEKYLFYIKEELKKRDMPTELALLPVVESAFDPFAYSHGQAAGMWQFIPGTAEIFNLESNWWYEGRRDVITSTQAALDYLQYLHELFDNDWLLALAAYNSGLGTVSRSIKKNKKLGRDFDYWSLDLPKETQNYVPKLIALAQVVSKPKQYSIQLKAIPNTPYFDQASAQGQIDLSQVATLAEVSTNEIYLLNPAFNRWATEPNVDRNLLIPYHQRFTFEKKLKQLPNNKRLAWHHYTVRSGDTLSTVAQQNKINTAFLKSINGLSSNKIGIGQSLLIPRPLGELSSYEMSQEQRELALSHKKPSNKQQKTIHIVRRNDTLSGIAQTYGVSVKKISQWNNIAPKDTLREKQSITIWLTNDEAGWEKSKQRKVHRKVFYQVKKGDNLSSIAQRFKVSVSDIKAWNNLSHKKYLQPKDKLVLKVNVAK